MKPHERLTFFREGPLLVLLAGTALALGLLMPTIFEWGSEPGSRHRFTRLAYAGALAFAAAVCVCALLWRHARPELARAGGGREKPGVRLAGRGAALLAAALAAAILWLSPALASQVAVLAALAAAWSAWREDRATLLRTAALLACLFLPCAWAVAFNKPFGNASGLAVSLPIGPGLLAANFVRGAFERIKTDDMAAVAAMIVTVKILAGLCLARHSARVHAAYTLLILLSSALGSLAMHAMYRM